MAKIITEEMERLRQAEPKRRLKKSEIAFATDLLIKEAIDGLYRDYSDFEIPFTIQEPNKNKNKIS